MRTELTDAELLERYHLIPAAACVKAALGLECDLFDRLDEELCAVIRDGIAAGVSLYRVKRSMALPRVERVLGMLQGLQPLQLLDVGAGRGTFLWPLVERFPELQVMTIDRSESKVQHLTSLIEAGIPRLAAAQMDACDLSFADASFDVVTALEVLEHIPDWETAFCECLRVAGRTLLISVPSKADENPEHLHLITKNEISALVQESGSCSVNFVYVLNHMIAVVSK